MASYDPTGLLTSKTDANAKAVSYSYTAAGQPYQRTWARGVVTTYAYSATTGEQTSITYSDGTPSVTFNSYNRQGRPTSISDHTGTRTLEYCECGKPIYEILPSAFYGSRKLTWKIDATTSGALGRSYGVTVAENNVSEYDVTYGFDASGRFNSNAGFTYTYTTNSHLLASIAHTSSGWTQTRTYLSNANALDIIETKVSTTSKAKFDHTHDALYRATTILKTGEVFNTYGNGTQGLETDHTYNDRSELTADSTTLGGSTTPLGGRDDYFTYDPIGNRASIVRSGSTVNYTANNLNQYTAFTGSSTHTYDDDGNLANDGVWTYAWDAENRLVTQDSIAHVRKLEFKYDHMGRRVQKTVREGWNGSAYTTVPTERKFLHDGHDLIQEFNGTLGHVANYAWGPDVSGVRGGAGGVGGLAFIYDYATGHVLQPAYDALGNVAGLIRADGVLVAKYEYDAFGQSVVASGSYAAVNPFRFATKYTDVETGHVNFGYRYYGPSLARFLNRDPIAEDGGLNLYGYVGNNPVNIWDYLGMFYTIQQVGQQVIVTVPVVFDKATPEQREKFLADARSVWGNGKPVAGTNVSINIVELNEKPEKSEAYNTITFVDEPEQDYSGRTFVRSPKHHGTVLINTAHPRKGAKVAAHEMGHILSNENRYLDVFERPDGTTYVAQRSQQPEDKRIRSVSFRGFEDNIMAIGDGTKVTKENVAEILDVAGFTPAPPPRLPPTRPQPLSPPPSVNLVTIVFSFKGGGQPIDIVDGNLEQWLISAEIKRKSEK